MTLREFCKLSILCKDDELHIVVQEGCYARVINFNGECSVGNAPRYLRSEILDSEIACVTPSRDAFVVYFKEELKI